MALVDYVSSDEDVEEVLATNDSKTAILKRKRDEELPPLPSKFHDLYSSTTKVSVRDDPALHGGRKRVTPHVEGNWPTHLYIEWYPSMTENGSLSQLISKLKESASPDNALVTSFLVSDLGAPLPLHISLSRPLAFSSEVKDMFVTALEALVKSSGIRPFNIMFSGLDWVPNFEKTRWFLVLRLQEPQLNSLNKLLHLSNKVVHDYDQPALYVTIPELARQSTMRRMKGNQVPRRGSADWRDLHNVSEAFHVSIAWMLQKPSAEFMTTTKSMFADGFEDVKKVSFKVEEMKAKVGNAVKSIPLPKQVKEEKALWED